MLPLIPLALSVVPELIKMIAGDKAGAVAGRVADVVQEVTGTADPAEAQRKLAADPALATTLRVRLAEIALDSQKAFDLAAEQKRQAELSEIQKMLENTQGARSTMVDLVKSGSPVAWGAPVVSFIVTIGFFAFLTLLITIDLQAMDDKVASIINITVGTLAAAFATVVNFWLGSSQGSRSKDAASSQLQAVAMEIGRSRAAADPPAAAAPAAAAPPPQNGDAIFDQCLAVVLDKEGGFSDHPRDRGGPTNLGITMATLAQWRGIDLSDISAEGREHLVADLQALTRREAAEIYRANYWLPMRCGDLPPPVALMLFDFGVNAGPRTAVKLLQRLACVTDDGSVGPKTMAAVAALEKSRVIDGFTEARLAHYRTLKDFDVFGNGWTTRTTQVAELARAMAG